MGSGYYPLQQRFGAGRKLAKISRGLKALLGSRDPYGDADCLPCAYDNDQYDNAAMDGGYETYLHLASELIDRCLEKANCQCKACQQDGAHYSDCAVHREPSAPNGPCDCGLVDNPTAEGCEDPCCSVK
jgi:hypothetical protein